ncbi:MAG: TRAP transporter substrate-binding protein [Planctomycetaceae bacterium]|nr:TRAP transporter substrate-binding protein [Planctomycetaceae bacterium]
MHKWITQLFCVALFLVLAAGTQSVEAGQFRKMVIQVGSATPKGPQDGYCNLVEAISERLEEWTDGAVSLDYLGSGQLGNDAELAEAIKLGTIDAAMITVSAMSSSVPSVGIFDMPYIFATKETVFDFIDNSPVMKKIDAKLRQGFNAVAIGWAHNGYRNVLNNIRPITTADDLTNLKIRVMESPVYMQLFRLLGANPTPMSISECMTGLEQRTIDGMDHPISAAVSEGTYKLVKYYDLTNHTCTEAVFVVNGDFFDSFPPELQEMFVRAGMEARAVQREKLEKREQAMLAEIEASGVKVGRDVDIPSIQRKVLPMWKDYRDNLDPEIFDEAMHYLGLNLK